VDSSEFSNWQGVALPMVMAGTKAPVRVWADLNMLDYNSQNQLRHVADLPWTFAVAVMPDVHFGKGATVGSVIAMKQALAPGAVGVDVGCGMTALQTSLQAVDLPEDLERVV